MVGDPDRAEDITQEVFISALRRLRDTERPIAFKPWIYEIAKNACIDEFRRTRRASEVPLDLRTRRPKTASRRAVASVPGPDVAVESKQRLEDLRGAFRGLSESHHRILVMRELEGLSYGQIGERLGMSPADGREHAVPRPPPAGRGVRGARQRPPLRAHARADRRAAGPHAAPPRGARAPPARAASLALPAVPSPRRCSRAAPSPSRIRPPPSFRRGPAWLIPRLPPRLSSSPPAWSSSSPPARSSGGRPARWCFGSPPAICRRGPWSVRSRWRAGAGRRLRIRRSRHRDRIRSQ